MTLKLFVGGWSASGLDPPLAIRQVPGGPQNLSGQLGGRQFLNLLELKLRLLGRSAYSQSLYRQSYPATYDVNSSEESKQKYIPDVRISDGHCLLISVRKGRKQCATKALAWALRFVRDGETAGCDVPRILSGGYQPFGGIWASHLQGRILDNILCCHMASWLGRPQFSGLNICSLQELFVHLHNSDILAIGQ
jgi:hypothetical protein